MIKTLALDLPVLVPDMIPPIQRVTKVLKHKQLSS
jgi:hypothetical protein